MILRIDIRSAAFYCCGFERLEHYVTDHYLTRPESYALMPLC